jgi:hypothetical protein
MSADRKKKKNGRKIHGGTDSGDSHGSNIDVGTGEKVEGLTGSDEGAGDRLPGDAE